MTEFLLPVPPPSRTYLGLGVMLGPYARDVMYLSGHCYRGWQTTFRGAPIIFVTPIALKLLQLGPNSKRGKLPGDHCGFLSRVKYSYSSFLLFLISKYKKKVVLSPIDVSVKTLYFIKTASFRLKMARNAGNCIIFAGKSII